MAMQIYFRERILDWASRLFWKTVPCNMQLSGGLYRSYSKETAKLLRHGHLHARDGPVRFKQYADSMHHMMLKSGGGRRRYTKSNSDTWLCQTWAELIFYLRSGCDKPRYQILAPANLDAGGDLVALEKYSQHVVAIRAVGGHSYLRVDPAEMGRVKVTHETCPQLFHVTYRNNIPSLNKTGLRPGGLNPYGRNEVFFSCKSQFEGRHATAYGSNVNNLYQKILERVAERKYKAACAAMISNPTGQPVLEGYPFNKGDSTLCIDTKKAEACGIEFWQTAALAIVTNKSIPPTCFIHVEDLKTGEIIFASPKTVRPPTHHEESECKRARPATTPAGNWLDSHTVQASSSSAGGNLTATKTQRQAITASSQ